MRFLSALFTFSQITYALSLDTDVVIVSNNDLDASNPNRASALLLRTPLACSTAASTCAELQETLLLTPTSTGLTPENLTSILASDRHGAALAPGSRVWIAGNCKSLPFPSQLCSNVPQLVARHSL